MYTKYKTGKTNLQSWKSGLRFPFVSTSILIGNKKELCGVHQFPLFRHNHGIHSFNHATRIPWNSVVSLHNICYMLYLHWHNGKSHWVNFCERCNKVYVYFLLVGAGRGDVYAYVFQHNLLKRLCLVLLLLFYQRSVDYSWVYFWAILFHESVYSLVHTILFWLL